MVTSGLKKGCAVHPSGSKIELVLYWDAKAQSHWLLVPKELERDTQSQVLLDVNDRFEDREARGVNTQCNVSVGVVTQTHPLATIGFS